MKHNSKKEKLAFIFSVAAIPLALLGICLYSLSQPQLKPAGNGEETGFVGGEEEFRWDGPPLVQWDDKTYYWTGEKVYEDLLCPDAAGTISSVVDSTEPVTENGQTNIARIQVGDEIRRTAYGDAVALFMEGEWIWFERREEGLGPEDTFYIPQNVWRLFRLDDEAAECGDVVLTAEQAVVDKAFFEEQHAAFILKNDSDRAISYRRGAMYVLKEIDGEWHYWLGEKEPEDAALAEPVYVLFPSEEKRFLSPMSRAFPYEARKPGKYRIGMYVDFDSGTEEAGKNGGERAFVFAEVTVE